MNSDKKIPGASLVAAQVAGGRATAKPRRVGFAEETRNGLGEAGVLISSLAKASPGQTAQTLQA
eukprot:6409502-Prorocentrum_lima.AAC.1